MSRNRCPASRPAPSSGTQTGANSPSMRRCERRNGNGRVCGPATSADDGVVSMPMVVLIPKPLDPLQKFKVISDASETDGTMID